MRFDFISFLIGFVSASVLAFILYRMRSQIAVLRQSLQQQAGAAGKYLANSAEGRYFKALIESLNGYHLAGGFANLADIYVEPRFVVPPFPLDPTEEKTPTVFHVVPQLHDFPASYAPYNVPALTLDELRSGERHVAILGLPGTGKSTTLAILGLIAAGVIAPPILDLTSDPVFEEEIKNLPPDEKDKRIRQRQELQRRAMEQLHSAQKDKHKEATQEPQRQAVDFKTLLPIFIHLRDVDLRPEAFGLQPPTVGADGQPKASGPQTKPVDPAEPLVKAVQQRLGGLAASFAPRLIYKRLTEGTALVLIDGYDDLTPAERAPKLEWLARFMAIYEANFIVVTGPESGFDALMNIGLSPCFMRGWGDSDYAALIERWQRAWIELSKTQKGLSLPDDKLIRRVSINNRGRLPFEVTLKIWAAFSDDEKEQGRRGWYDFFVRGKLTNPESRPLLEKIAASILDRGTGVLTRDHIKEIVAPVGADGKPPANADELVNRVTGSALLNSLPGGTFAFAHPLLNAYLAAEALTDATVTEAATKQSWALAMPFAAIRLSMDTAVTQHLASQQDLLYNRLFGLVSWLLDSPANAPWRAEIFKRLAVALIGPSQFPLIRERAMAAMVSTRDKGVLFVLKQALSSTNPLVRRLGCIGLGALGETEPIKDLETALRDSDADVQLAAGLALGAIGSDKALETMVAGMVEGEPSLRRAVSEALAALPGVGHETLREAIVATDMMMRHAAVFGLARIRAAWSMALLYRTLLEDEQWYVRNAAEQAFKELERPDRAGIAKFQDADKLTWLIAWAAERGEGVPAGPNSRQVLVRVLQEGAPDKRAAAAETLAELGHFPALKPLYNALRDKEEPVRAKVYEALGKLQIRLGQTLPNPA